MDRITVIIGILLGIFFGLVGMHWLGKRYDQFIERHSVERQSYDSFRGHRRVYDDGY